MKPYHQALLAVLIANIIWGATPPILKWSMSSIEPFTLGFIRFLIATIILLPFAYNKLHFEKKDFWIIFLTAFVSVPLHIGLFLAGLQFASSINVPIIGAAAPIFIIILSSLFFNEKLRKKMIIGTFVSLVGVLTIIIQPLLEEGFDGALLGNILFLLSTLTGIAHLFLLKKLTPRYSTITLTFWTFFLGQIMFLPMMIWEMQSASYVLDLNTHSLIGILYGGFLASGLAWFLFAYATKKLSASEIGLFSYLSPIITALVAMPLLGETITFSYVLGSVLVFIGIFIAEGHLPHPHQIHKDTKHGLHSK